MSGEAAATVLASLALVLAACAPPGQTSGAVPVVQVDAVGPTLAEAEVVEEDDEEALSGPRRPSWVKAKTPEEENRTRDAATRADKMAARDAYKQAQRAFRDGKYQRAVESFITAHRIYPGASPKHKIALCYDRLGRRKEAINAYHWFIQSQPSSKYAERLEESKLRLAELQGEQPPVPPKPVPTQLRD